MSFPISVHKIGLFFCWICQINHLSAEKSTAPCLKSHILFPVFVSPTVIDFYIFITWLIPLKYQSKSEITLWNSAKARISLRKKTPITTILLPRDELWYEEKPGNAKLRWKREAVCPTAGGSRISSNRTFAALFPYIYNRSTKEECQMRKRKLKIFLTPTENSIVIQSLNHLRNALLRENRDTGCLDELLLKVMCAPVKKM